LDEPIKTNARFVVVTAALPRLKPQAAPKEVEAHDLASPTPMTATTPPPDVSLGKKAVSFLWLYLIWGVLVIGLAMFAARFARQYAAERRRVQRQEEDGEE
jgi:hypothetical protein